MVDEKLLGSLKKSHLFKRVREDDIMQLAEHCDKVTIEKDQVLYNQGSRANFFYIITKGKIHHFYTNQGERQILGTMVTGDYLGLDALFNKGRRISTATADEYTELYRLRIAILADLIKRLPRVQGGIDMITKSYRMAWNSTNEWLTNDEILYYIARRHPIILVKRLLIPLILFLFSITAFGLGITLSMSFLWMLTIILFISGVFLGVYSYLDWQNDFCFLTNKRVGWVEKALLISEDRREALVQSIRSVSSKTDWLGRTLKYGSVSVNTYSGNILMENISYPEQVTDLIDELRKRTDLEVKRKELRIRIGKEKPADKNKSTTGMMTPIVNRRGDNTGKKRERWSASLKMRLESGNQITFHKHWIILLAKVSPPFVLLLAVFISILVLIFGNNTFSLFTLTTMILLILLLGFVGLAWFVYQYVDWQNDVYRVTPDVIIDEEKKPLGEQNKKTASLDNILSVDVEKPGILNLILNYGDVIADVSGKQFFFHNIYDPVAAQQDIMFRMDLQRRNKVDGPTMDWIAMYDEETKPPQVYKSDI